MIENEFDLQKKENDVLGKWLTMIESKSSLIENESAARVKNMMVFSNKCGVIKNERAMIGNERSAIEMINLAQCP